MRLFFITLFFLLTSCSNIAEYRGTFFVAGDCYTGERDPLVKIVEVKRFGLFWETQLPDGNPNAYTHFYSTYKKFSEEFPERADCWTKEDDK